MSIFVDAKTRLLVQGITGREGSFHARQMLEYGTAVVGGVTPPTIFVPYSIICFVWNEPSRPVMPCTITVEVSSLKTLMRPFLPSRARRPSSRLRPCRTTR